MVPVLAPQMGTLATMRGSVADTEVAAPPCECPVAPILLTSSLWKSALDGFSFSSIIHCAPATCGSGVPCRVCELSDATTTNPCEAS